MPSQTLRASAASTPCCSRKSRAVSLGQAQVVEHRPDIEQLEVRLQSQSAALQGTEQEHSARMVEEQVVLGVADEIRRLPHQRAVGDCYAGDRLN
jgi:hypothetical protein